MTKKTPNNNNNNNDDDDDKDGLNINKGEIDLYVLFNVQRQASTADLQRAFKTLSLCFHPDKVVGTPTALLDNDSHQKRLDTAQETFLQIKRAHDILMDPVLRFAYDHGGMLAVQLVTAVPRGMSQSRDSQHEENEDAKERDHDETKYNNLYYLLQDAASDDDRRQILQQALYHYHWEQAHHHAQETSTTSFYSSNVYRSFSEKSNSTTSLSSFGCDTKTAHLQLMTRCRLLTLPAGRGDLTLALQAKHRTDTLSQADVSANLGWNTVLAPGTALEMSASQSRRSVTTSGRTTTSTTPRPGIVWSLRTVRTFTDQSTILLAVSVPTGTTTAAPVGVAAVAKENTRADTAKDNKINRKNKENGVVKNNATRDQSRQQRHDQYRPLLWNATLLFHRHLLLPNLSLFRHWSDPRSKNVASWRRIDASWKVMLQPGATRHHNENSSNVPSGGSRSSNNLYQLINCVLEIGNTTIPQYKFRWSLRSSPYPLKLSWRPNRTWTATLATAFPLASLGVWRGKLTHQSSFGTGADWNSTRKRQRAHQDYHQGRDDQSPPSYRVWTVQYSLKYDTLAAWSGRGSLWTILLDVRANDWTLRIPIGIHGPQVVLPPIIVTLWSAILWQFTADYVAQLHWWRQWPRTACRVGRRPRKKYVESLPSRPSFDDFASARLEMIRRTAAKKRHLEEQNGGLIITKAAWHNDVENHQNCSLVDVLQFWVVDGNLNESWETFTYFLPKEQRGHALTRVNDSSKFMFIVNQWLRQLLPSFASPIWPWSVSIAPDESSHLLGSSSFSVLTIRYRYHGMLYEVCLEPGVVDGGETGRRLRELRTSRCIQLPNDGATLLGEARYVT